MSTYILYKCFMVQPSVYPLLLKADLKTKLEYVVQNLNR